MSPTALSTLIHIFSFYWLSMMGSICHYSSATSFYSENISWRLTLLFNHYLVPSRIHSYHLLLIMKWPCVITNSTLFSMAISIQSFLGNYFTMNSYCFCFELINIYMLTRLISRRFPFQLDFLCVFELSLNLRKFLLQSIQVVLTVSTLWDSVLTVIPNKRLSMLRDLRDHCSHHVLRCAISFVPKRLWSFCILEEVVLTLSWHIRVIHGLKHLLLHYDLWIAALVLSSFGRSKANTIRIDIFSTIHGKHLVEVSCRW